MRTLFWIIWDAASKMVVDKMLLEEELPGIRRLLESGVGYEVELHQYNCQTPCALAVQFTGKLPGQLKIGGYYTPVLYFSADNELQYNLSFKNKNVRDEVLWRKEYIGRHKICMCQIPYSNLEQNDISLVDGFTNCRYNFQYFQSDELEWIEDSEKEKRISYTDISMFETEFRILINCKQEAKIFTLLHNDSGNSLSVRADEYNKDIKNDFWLDSITGFKFMVYTKENDSYVFLMSDACTCKVEGFLEKERLITKTGAFLGRAYGKLYRRGVFGKQYYNGGCGNAEKIYLDIVRQVALYFQKLNEFMADEKKYDMVIAYQPCIDEVSHEIFGWWQNAMGKEKEFYWKMLKYAYVLGDNHIRTIHKKCSKKDCIVLTSDHGMYGVMNEFYLNTWLNCIGLLNYNSKGEIDLTSSKCFYHPCDSGAFFFGGNINQDEKEDIIRCIKNIKLNNRNMIDKVLDTTDDKVFGDLFIVPAENVKINPSKSQILIAKTNKTGCHTARYFDKSMKAIFFASGNIATEMKYRVSIKNTDIKEMISACLRN